MVFVSGSGAELLSCPAGNWHNGDTDPREAEERALLRLERCEQLLNISCFRWRARLNELWGPTPPYRIQPEDGATFFCGALWYTWVGDLMYRAAREELREADMPRPTEGARGHDAGLLLSRLLSRQRRRRHAWDVYAGALVRHVGDAASEGALRWVGERQRLRQRSSASRLFAGVEWRVPPARRLKEARRDVSRSPFTAGVVDGEHLFQTASGEPTATCERIEDIVILSPAVERQRGNCGMPRATQTRPKPISVARAVFDAFGWSLYQLFFLRLIRDASQLALPVVLHSYIQYFHNDKQTWRDGLLLVFAFTFLTLVQSLAGNKLTQLGYRCGYIFKNALQGVLFEKCTTIARKALAHPEMSVGRIVNMLSSDTNSASNFPILLSVVFGAPLQLIVALALLYFLVGWCAFAGFGVLVFFMPLQGFLMRRYYTVYAQLSKATDARLKATNEFLSGMRVVKFMSWEPSFIRDIEEKRRAEILAVRNSQYLYIAVSFLTSTIPGFVIAVVFLLYHFSGNELTPSVVFPTLALLGIIQTPFVMVTVAFSAMARFVVSMRRISRFLESEDVDDGIKELLQQHDNKEKYQRDEDKMVDGVECTDSAVAAEFINATISTYIPRLLSPSASERRAAEKRRKKNGNNSDNNNTNSNNDNNNSGGTTYHGDAAVLKKNECYEVERKDLLHNITLSIPKGKLTCVIGDTGSGKSTLLDSLLKSHDITTGKINVVSNIAYVPQEACIINATLKENILFFSDMDESRFQRVLRCTQLEDDIRLLPHGVETEIGEKGVNLSGGQKARVSLARAVYATGRELYLLDDPLSALDAHVGERVMHECILGELRGKTRLLVTHHLNILHKADYIVVMQEGGKVSFTGNYEEYKKRFAVDCEEGVAGTVCLPSPAPQLHSFSFSPTTAEESDSTCESVTALQKQLDGELPTCRNSTNTTNINTTTISNNDNNNNNNNNSNNNSNNNNSNNNEVQCVCSDQVNEKSSASKTSVTGKLITNEEKMTGAVSRQTYLRYAEMCGGLIVCGLVLVVFLVTELVIVLPSLWLSFWSVKKYDLSSNTYLLVYVGFVVASAFTSPLRNFSAYAVLRAGAWRLHKQLLRSVAVAPISFFDTTPLGRVLNRFSKDMNTIDGSLQGSIIFLVRGILSVISSIVVMAVSQYFALIVIIPCLLLYYKLMLFYNSANREMRRIANRANSPVFSALSEMLSSRWTIAAYGRASDFLTKALHTIDTVYACSYMQTVCDCWLAVRVELISNVLLTSVAFSGVLFTMCKFAIADIGLLSLSLTMAININSFLKYVVNQAATVEAEMNSVERILHYTLNIEHEDLLDDIDEAIRQEKKEQNKRGHRKQAEEAHFGCNDDDESSTAVVQIVSGATEDGMSSLPLLSYAVEANCDAVAGSIELRDVTMRYRPGLPHVLCGVTMNIAAGQKVGIVGRTGSGKSSLMLAFMRIVEIDGGQIFISGRPIHSYRLRDLRRLFSMIPQDPLLFNGSVRTNLDPLGTRSDAEVVQALRLVGLHGRLAGDGGGGLNGRVEEGGANFSAGQRQLLCMARALLRRGCRFILMDEATANIDPALDALIQHAVSRVFATRTVITIAHRLMTVAAYDTVFLMEEGRVVEAGPPRELVRRADSRFAQMVGALGDGALQEFLEATR